MSDHKYYMEHREEIIAYATKWNKEHKEARKEIMLRDNKKRKYLKRQWHEKKWFGQDGLLNNQSKCYVCEEKEDLVIHHLDGNNGRNGKDMNNNIENLVILCRKCHPKYHNRWHIKEVVSNV